MTSKVPFWSLVFLAVLSCASLIKPPAAHAQGQTIYCASDDGKRNYCSANTRGGVQMTRQRSGSACTQGSTWGWDNRGIWVDRGCRAEFVVGNGGNGGNWGGGNGGNWGGNNGSGQTIYCASDDGKRNYCSANTRGGVRLTQQRSGSACTQGSTWGWDNRGIWVDRGCRANFVTGSGGGGGGWNGGGNNGGNVGQTFTCSSNNGGRNYCNLPQGVNPNNVSMSRQLSGSPCTPGQTWGVDRRGVWVDRGCRAEFRSNF